MESFIGTSGWSYNHWKGVFYPLNLSKSKWFDFYCKRFNTVEVNATFYRRFKDEVFIRWKAASPENFRFVLKMPGIITHTKKLKNVEKDIEEFIRQASLLGKKLGCILMQLPPFMTYNPELLRNALGNFDNKIHVAVEFRNESWMIKESVELLRSSSAIYCNADSPAGMLNEWVTSDTVYFRMHGRNNWYRYDYSYQELKQVTCLLHNTDQHHIKTAYIFFNNDFQGHAPQNAASLIEIIKEENFR